MRCGSLSIKGSIRFASVRMRRKIEQLWQYRKFLTPSLFVATLVEPTAIFESKSVP
jgi:hypothetical protein